MSMQDYLKGEACILTGGLLDTIHAKTTHGLLRQSDRFQIKAVIDHKFAGQNVQDVLSNIHADVPIYESIEKMLEAGVVPTFAIIGMATKGGVLPPSLYPEIKDSLQSSIHVINGLHQPISEIDEFKEIMAENKVQIHDIRKPKPFEQLHFWNGKIREVEALKLGILGTDCSIGKRTTAKLLVKALNQSGIKAEMIYTGQTGWLQGTKYGFIFDATPNDFIPGEIEHAIHECWLHERPEVIIVEGQASLLNPGGPCGSEFVISGKLDGVFLQHHPIREKYNNLEKLPDTIADPMIDVGMINMMGSDVWAFTLNTAGMNEALIAHHTELLEGKTGLPIVAPLEHGVGVLVKMIKQKLEAADHSMSKAAEVKNV
ncbi:DUF1611 domain-containing protein [Fulvivirga maritima]|uniref:DUF1611 domain-containing protein n=1 Tax=Fulvivirga maritima TaxID=2904247 RepID=UPI001F182CC8|nr:DUF1611 domain-containing protein [Fulvivirga maritima]UII24419.1 DUF1611 domain-containing protein [Fulvivirga maritima]